jgi:hypothetical protein
VAAIPIREFRARTRADAGHQQLTHEKPATRGSSRSGVSAERRHSPLWKRESFHFLNSQPILPAPPSSQPPRSGCGPCPSCALSLPFPFHPRPSRPSASILRLIHSD